MSDHTKIYLVIAVFAIAGFIVWRVNMQNIIVPAKVAYGEAEDQGDAGLQAVINVIYNRANIDLFNDGVADWWGETPFQVASKPFQFSAYNEGSNRRRVIDALDDSDPVYVRALGLSIAAREGRLPDITGGATHYYAYRGPNAISPPSWVLDSPNRIETARIGDHKFFKGIA